MTVKVKICGLTVAGDVDAAVALGADALGFNCWPGSKRYVTPDRAARLVERLPPFVAAVGVFVNQPRAHVLRLIREVGLTHVQLHGDERPEDCAGFPVPVLRGVRVTGAAALRGLRAYPVQGLLIDAPAPGYGGGGQPFDWRLLRGWRAPRPFLLAGGLTPSNVAQAIRAVRPYGVDVASGVEQAPGRKNMKKLRAFLRAAKGA
ncbi:MAG: phosphoribosylanthranilate isomerase [Myxococcaceae bacterium]|nr:phosphoribosylanthranilate isomerase [Myxococcaceae bacterium]